MSDPRTHDYTHRGWGHDYIFLPHRGGLEARITGWGHGIRAGDYLLLQNGDGSSRYVIRSIQYERDPPDMWSASAEFAPRERRTA